MISVSHSGPRQGSTRLIFPGGGDAGEGLLEARSPERDNDERVSSCNPTHQMKEKAKKKGGDKGKG